MEDFYDTIEDIVNEVQREYNEEYKTKQLNIVTTKDDICGEDRPVTVMKYYTVKSKEHFTERHYERHYGETATKHIEVIRPRKFYSEAQVRNFMDYINKTAGRTLEEAEMGLLLKTITRGRQYELTCLIDRTEEFKDTTMWGDIK